MRFEELNWMDVETYLKQDDRVILVLGACEQHGYLSLATDTLIPRAIADAASQQSGVLVAPPLHFGVSPHFTTYPGTISLRLSTYLLVVEDMLRSLAGYGFRRILILNGHGGNDPVRARLIELRNELPEVKIAWYAWWTAPNTVAVATAHGLKPFHANWNEAFPFTRVAELPDAVKEPPVTRPILNAQQIRAAYGDGVFGGAYQAPDEVMAQVLDAAVKDVVALLDL